MNVVPPVFFEELMPSLQDHWGSRVFHGPLTEKWQKYSYIATEYQETN